MARPSQQSHAIDLTSFLRHVPDDATEGAAEHSSRLQPSINFSKRYLNIVTASYQQMIFKQSDQQTLFTEFDSIDCNFSS